ncbi:hypothetical protein Hypma_009776 [Hypsizygus marmoreus]|uniref:BTB domain-containing protein n=1 Tax=Hypsizygus marmoreus TaxID=39966 RepID=A0A369JM26_HYPMA|nr:hypothetical protein Hypma_009776 [Hypsizygus marmoreus]
MTITYSTLREDDLIKHPIFWFDDGSVVLHVQNYAFKIHRMLLARHSNFFAQTDTIPNGTTTKFDTPPETHIVIDPSQHVRAKDVEALLEHFYHDTPLFRESRFTQIASILRASSPLQLDFPSIHSLAKERLDSMFPPGTVPLFQPDDPEEALALAIEYDISSMRKVMYYNLVTSPETNFDTDATQSPTDTVATAGPTSTSSSDVGTTETADHPDVTRSNIAHQRPLSQNDAKRCTQLMARIIDYFTPMLFTPPGTPHMACTDVFADTWMTLVIQPALENDGVYKPLETLEGMKATDWAKEGLCQSCIRQKHEEWTEEQQNIWKAMDEWLGLVTDNSSVSA